MCKFIIKADHITKQVRSGSEQIQILDAVSLNLGYGEKLAIRGRSGSGKSTLLSILAALMPATSGRIQLLGQDITDLSESARIQIRKADVGVIFQSFQLIASLPARENVALALEIGKGVSVSQALMEADTLLSALGLGNRLHHLPNQLSGGEQQRVAIARAFICKPKILFADEPTGSLDQTNGDLVEQMLFKLVKDSGTSLLLVTHDQTLAEHCDREIFLDHGHIVETPSC